MFHLPGHRNNKQFTKFHPGPEIICLCNLDMKLTPRDWSLPAAPHRTTSLEYNHNKKSPYVFTVIQICKMQLFFFNNVQIKFYLLAHGTPSFNFTGLYYYINFIVFPLISHYSFHFPCC